MSKDEWAQVQEALKGFFRVVRLKIDGYDVALSLVMVKTYKNAIAIYIGGVMKGAWLIDDCEERRRFLQKKERSLLSPKAKAEFKKLSKKSRKELEKYNLKYAVYSSHWSSFGALKKHFIANNENIELVSIG